MEAIMTAVMTLARMIATSLVLVATAAFVLQGAASAQGHRHADKPCHTGSGVTVAHSLVAAGGHSEFSSAVGHAHEHAAADDMFGDDAELSGHELGNAKGNSCCGKFCSALVCVASPGLASAKLPLQRSPVFESQVLESATAKGLKRPPRAFSMT